MRKGAKVERWQGSKRQKREERKRRQGKEKRACKERRRLGSKEVKDGRGKV